MRPRRITQHLRIKIALRRGNLVTAVRSEPRFSRTEFSGLWMSCVRRGRRFSFARRTPSEQEQARRRKRRLARKTLAVCPACGRIAELFRAYTGRLLCWPCSRTGE